jgi:hypothetical protein
MSYEKIFSPIEDLWMEKNNINQHVANDGGSMKDVNLDIRLSDNGDFIVVLNLTVSGIEELSSEAEEGILDEIEWATDEISDEQWSSVDLDPEKLQDFEINLIYE